MKTVTVAERAAPLRAASGALVLVAAALCLAPGPSPTVHKHALGPTVNTSTHRELLPVISADGQTLWFIREGLDTEVGERARGEADSAIQALESQLDKLPADQRAQFETMIAEMKKSSRASAATGVQKQTIWMSERQADGTWGNAIRAPSPLNDELSPTGVATALPDGNTLLVGRDSWTPLSDLSQIQAAVKDAPDFLTLAQNLQKRPTAPPLPIPDPTHDDQNQVVGLTRRTSDGWTPIELLRIVGYAHQRGKRSDYYLAPNGRVLLLSLVNSESMNGSRDLFVSQLLPDGRWSKPSDVTELNSAVEEISPWIAPDNRTLYFSSNRAGGLGEYDIWMSRRIDDSWLKWSPPQNLGPEINTPLSDMNLAVDATGRYAFMSIGERGKEDIYEFELPPALRPIPVAFVRGRVTDPSGRPVPAGILYEILRTAQTAGQANCNPPDGRYQIALPIGEDYGFRASAAGYLAVSDRLDLREAKDQQVFERDLVLVPLATGVPIRLNNIFFDTAKATLLPESRAELDRLAALLRDAPSMRIDVRGHTDSIDSEQFNQKLSEARAGAVVEYLVHAGIDSMRLQSHGFGESQPIARNDTEKGRQQNRRVEFVILQR